METTLEDIAGAVSATTGLECSPADLERVLAAFMSSPTIWDAVGLASRPFHLVAEAARQMEQRGLLSFSWGQVRLTRAGRGLCRSRGLRSRRRYRCRPCQGRGISLGRLQNAFERFERLAAGRPSPMPEFDQAYVTADTTMARLALMADRGDLAGKELMVLGDDDLMGLAAALTGLPRRVAVLEIDVRLNQFMEQAARSEGLSLEVVTHDLSMPLPQGLAASFDAFFTDPPDAPGGMRLFLSRGIEALKGPGKAGYFGLTVIESSLYRWKQLQQYLVQDCGVVITDLIPEFSTYVNWDYLGSTFKLDEQGLLRQPQAPWYRSALHRIELLPGSRPCLEGLDRRGLYMGRESLAWGIDTEDVMLEEADSSRPMTLQEVENIRRGDG
ncbi:MAG TPA: bis-aminopropyl spermidine synthase family protein [Dehalococcoidia bacterium]|nr:bis-aminopropyl spermidine synthase family protein [Dehalococcoidia bacterium]